MSGRHDILGGDDFIDSMRYGGYRSPAHALAELIDNAFEANATKIEVVCKDGMETMVNNVERLHKVAVIDNGCGMSKETLWDSLRFGVGTRRARKGIGRFGMGLPYSSVSQCRRVEVYTWQQPGKVIFTRLDLDEIKERNMREVPEPEPAEIPNMFKANSKIFKGESGTMVVWSKLDRCIWKKSSTLFDRSERLVGRIYRKFLNSDKLNIHFVQIDNANKIGYTTNVRPNDPMYQMLGSSTPPPWDKEPMFNLDGDESTSKAEEPVKIGDKEYTVTMRFAFAKSEARKQHEGEGPAGSRDHGRHANFNLGISVVRGGREINMDQNLCQTYDPLERWWGAEVEFPPALDEFFGITNNKQEATNFSAVTKRYGVESQDKPAVPETTSDEDKVMEKIVRILNTRIRNMRANIKRQEKGRRTDDTRHDPYSKKVEQREESGHKSKTGEQIGKQDDAERRGVLAGELKPYEPPEELGKTVDDIIRNNQRVKFVKSDWSGSQFFDISLEGGVVIIKLNTSHNAYKNLMLLVEGLPDDIDLTEARKRLKDSELGLFLLLVSWARLEDEEPNENTRRILANARYHWGEIMEDFFR